MALAGKKLLFYDEGAGRELKNLSIIIPIYQNEKNIPELFEALSKVENNFEFIFVDDGSRDSSLSQLEEHLKKKSLSQMKIVKLTKNFGQIPAIYAGLRESTHEYKCILSADLQDDPELILNMLNEANVDYPLVIAERRSRSDGLFNKILSKFFYFAMRKVINPNYPIGGYDYCLFHQKVYDELLKFEQKNAHIFVILLWLGFKYKSIQYERKKRKKGKSQWTFSMKLKLFLDTMIGFSSFPMRIISLTGVFISGLGFLVIIASIYRYLLYGNPITGWTSLIVSLWLIGGLILITLGVLGEYLWRSFDASRERQIFVIDKVISQK